MTYQEGDAYGDTILSDRRHKAQRDYTCYICNKPIPKDSIYRGLAYVNDENDTFGYVRYHLACNWDED
jgi:hypothetical protein